MIEYGRDYNRLSGEIWKEHYVQREMAQPMSKNVTVHGLWAGQAHDVPDE